MRTRIEAALVESIRRSGRTAAAIARAAGVNRSVVTRLVNGERGVNLATAEAVADALGLELVLRRGPRRKGRRNGESLP
jgi:transcriptional regulator with XRE-family HTH domain